MTDEIKKLHDAFGKAMFARDHEALDVILAPWIGVAGALELMLDFEIDRHGEFRADESNVAFAELSTDTPAQITAANYVSLNSIVFTASPDWSEGVLDLKFAAVRLADGLHVGSLEVHNPA